MTALAGLLSVLLVAAGLLYTNAANRKQQEATWDQQQQALHAQASERFTTAIDQIGQEGTDKLSIRLGGVYALGRLMVDSPDDEPTIVDVLCAFIRTHSPAVLSWEDSMAMPESPDPVRTVAPPDIQAAVVVLARRPARGTLHAGIIDFSGILLNLHGIGLSSADLSGVDLAGADLSSANLSEANLAGAELSNADLEYANLSGAKLSSADLIGTHLLRANLSRAELSHAHLSTADLSEAFVANADLSYTDLSLAVLYNADLSHANLSYANLSDSDLHGADLRTAAVTQSALLHARNADDAMLPWPTAIPTH